MKPLLSNWTVVLAGRWNLDILNPEWVATEVFKREELEIDLVMQGMQAQLRYRFDNLLFVPRTESVLFSVHNTEASSLQAIEDAACDLMATLSVTPITALGINFTYIEDDASLQLANVFNVADSDAIADYGLSIKHTRVRREIEFEDRQLNLIISQLDDAKVRIALNYHLPVADTKQALEGLRGRVSRFRSHGEKLLTRVYDLTVEEEVYA